MGNWTIVRKWYTRVATHCTWMMPWWVYSRPCMYHKMRIVKLCPSHPTKFVHPIVFGVKNWHTRMKWMSNTPLVVSNQNITYRKLPLWIVRPIQMPWLGWMICMVSPSPDSPVPPRVWMWIRVQRAPVTHPFGIRCTPWVNPLRNNATMSCIMSIWIWHWKLYPVLLLMPHRRHRMICVVLPLSLVVVFWSRKHCCIMAVRPRMERNGQMRRHCYIPMVNWWRTVGHWYGYPIWPRRRLSPRFPNRIVLSSGSILVVSCPILYKRPCMWKPIGSWHCPMTKS